jgi:hypothetical protein
MTLKLPKTLKLLALSLFVSGASVAQTAELQVIHNSADPAAATVDIYVNGAIALPDFAFRTATPFITLPAGVTLNIGVAPGTSSSAADTIKNFEVTLASGNRYVAIANGVLNPASFAANPEGKSTGFTLFLKDNVQNAALNPSNVEFFGVHGATDAPAVDIKARGVATLLDSVVYSNVSGYLSVPAASYILDVTPAAGSPIVASYQADLSALGGGSAVVFASGFLNPAQNQNGEAFGLFAALANGTVVPFPAVSLARLQVIHNAADPGAASVDVYVNGALTLDNFAFRTATSFIDVPAGVPVNIGVAGPNSLTAADTLKNFEVTFQNGNTYVAIANGVLDPNTFAANPDGRSTGFTLLLKDMAREASTTPGSVDFFALHGATDAPGVDVIARNVATLVSNAKYSDITGYLTVPAASYILDVTLPGGTPIVASYQANLTSLGGGSAVVFASGFLNPAQNQNGEAFGLFAALANGTVVQFPVVSLARLQVIHNAADPAADSVDVYLNGTILLDDFKFRTATPYVDVPAGVLLNIGVAAGNSASANDTLKNFEVTLQNGNTYAAIASGVLNPASFTANPNGVSTGFTLLLKDQLRESALLPGNVDFIAVHGATDVPGVDILTGATPLVNDIRYSDIQNYVSVPAGSYVLDITPESNNSVVLLSFLANLNPFAGSSAIILASGFLNPAANQNGESVGLLAVFNDGTSALLSNVTGLNDSENSTFSISPNPASDFTAINFSEPAKASVITVANQLGQAVITENIPAGANRYELSTSKLSKGIYFIKISGEGSTTIQKLIVN